jgi:hypothetical protein
MNRTLSLPVQALIRTSERVLVFATNHKGLPEHRLTGSCPVFVSHRLRHVP